MIGSTTTTPGLKLETHLWVTSRCCSMPPYVGRAAWNCNRPLLTHGLRSMPIERMLRTICFGDSSKAKYRQRSPRRHAASTKCAATLVLPAPDVPDRRMLLPRKKPWPPSMPSSRVMPVEIRVLGAAWSRPSEEMGSTDIPFSSMRNGYSFVPCVEPRYLTMRRRRVEISSRIRWSSRITQSETNSSMPCRVSLSGPSRSAVMTVVRPCCLSHPNSRRISARRIRGFGNSAKSASSVSRTTRRAPTRRTASAMRMKRPSRSNSPVSEISAREMDTWSRNSFFSATRRFRSKPSDRAFSARSGIVSSNEMNTPGSPYCVAPRTRNSSPNIVFPAPAPPLTSVGRPLGRPPPVISSRPWMPVRVFRSLAVERGRGVFRRVTCMVLTGQAGASRWPRASGEPGDCADPAVGRRESRRPPSRASASAPGPTRHGRCPAAVV